MEYKQIINYPLYYINSNGDSVFKLCRAEYYKKIDGTIFRRKKPYGSYTVPLSNELYLELDGLIYRRIKILKNMFGYNFVKLTNSSGKRTLYIHRLVYRTFVGAIPSNMEINHIDHNKENNSVTNLELLTHSENLRKAVLHYGNKLKPRCKQCGRVISSKKENAVYCFECAKTHDSSFYKISRSAKYEHPSKDVLWALIKAKPFVEIGRIYGVTDNAIRRLAKSYGLPFRKRDIERQVENERNLLLDSHCIGEC